MRILRERRIKNRLKRIENKIKIIEMTYIMIIIITERVVGFERTRIRE